MFCTWAAAKGTYCLPSLPRELQEFDNPNWPKSQEVPVSLLRGVVNGLEVQRAYTPISPGNAEGYFEVLIKVSKPGQYGLEYKVFSLGTCVFFRNQACSQCFEWDSLKSLMDCFSVVLKQLCFADKNRSFSHKTESGRSWHTNKCFAAEALGALGRAPRVERGVHSTSLLSVCFFRLFEIAPSCQPSWTTDFGTCLPLSPPCIYLKNTSLSVGSCSWCADRALEQQSERDSAHGAERCPMGTGCICQSGQSRAHFGQVSSPFWRQPQNAGWVQKDFIGNLVGSLSHVSL